MVLTVIANAAEATECFNFFGFRPGMQKEAADELAAQYGLSLDKEHFTANPQTHEVYQMDFTKDEVLRITKGPAMELKLVQFLAEKLRGLGCKMDDDLSYLSYEYESNEGIQVWIGREDLHYSWCTILDKPRSQVAKEIEPGISGKGDAQEETGRLNFFGFYTGMSKEDADALASQYGLDLDMDHFKESPKTHEVYQMDFTLEEVQLITKGPNSFEELTPIVAKELRRSGRTLNETKTWRQYVYVSTDGVEVQRCFAKVNAPHPLRRVVQWGSGWEVGGGRG